MKNANQTARAAGNWQGMNWIRQEKRLAIYLRDGLACAYCGAGLEQDAKLSLDHITPHSKGGTNAHTNLITACMPCNSARGNREFAEWVEAVAVYRNQGVTAEQIAAHVSECVARELKPFLAEAKAIRARR